MKLSRKTHKHRGTRTTNTETEVLFSLQLLLGLDALKEITITWGYDISKYLPYIYLFVY